ncbi:MAG TPA: hypothetical protein VM370_05390 [Candidatus Thermoplasmatota archaeon]|nr:hypothetical protein [Candidatus Thermoplasmatota archaeon]
MRPRALLLCLLLAGCATAPAPASPVLLELPLDHDHAALAGHDLAQGLRRVGGIDLEALLAGEPGRASDLQFHEGLAAVAVNGGSGGFALLDATSLKVLSRYRSGSEDNWYVKFTPDGRYILLTANGNFQAAPAAEGALEALTRGTLSHAARGLQVVDIADPSRPTLVGAYASPIRLINVATWESGGATYVAASVVGDRSIQGAPAPGAVANGVDVLRLDDGGTPIRVARWDVPGGPDPAILAHDLSVEIHPLTGQTILYVAGWDAGALLVDVSNPTAPRLIGAFDPMDPAIHVHTVKPHPGLVEGRHLTLASPETFAGESSGRYHLLDTTDPAHPALVTTWDLPGNLTNAENLMWSPHEFSLAEGKAWTSNFHAGAIALDLRDELRPIAAWAAPPAPPREGSAKWAVDVETVVWHDGLVYAVDMGRGIDVLSLG